MKNSLKTGRTERNNKSKLILNREVFCMKRITMFLMVLIFGGFLVAGSVSALSLTFDSASLSGGSISYDGSTVLAGTDIVFNQITGTGTPSNSGEVLTITGGLLDFTTGNMTSESTYMVQFGGGGSFVLSGTVTSSINGVVSSGEILSGSFVGTSTIVGNPGLTSFTLAVLALIRRIQIF